MISDEKQLAAVCRVLLDLVGLSHLWTPDGPTEEAVKLRDADGGDLEGDARILFRTCWALSRGEGGPTMKEIRELDQTRLVAVGSLMRCLQTGPEAVDSWLRAAPPIEDLPQA